MGLHKPRCYYMIFVTLTKKHPILAKFCVNNATSIGNQSVKF